MKIIASIAAALAALAAADGALAGETPPPGGEPRAFTLPALETYALRNGVSVTLAPFGSVPKATIRAVVRVGNLNDGDKPWIADLTAGMMQEGAGGESAAAIATRAASLGGDFNLGVGLDETFATMDVLSENAPDAVSLIAAVLQRPDFPASEFEKVRRNNLRDLSVASSVPQTMADSAFAKLVYPGHPYAEAVLPDAGKVGAITLDDVRSFHAANFGAQRVHIYIIGKFDRAKVKSAIRKEFGKWAKGPAPLAAPPAEAAAPSVALIDRPGAVQSTVRLGKRVPPIDQSMDIEAADTMLGGYFSSRITRNIREDKGYTYSPNSAVSTEYKAAYWRQAADITTEATGAAIAEVLKEIRGLQSAAPAATELQGVKNYMNGIFVIQLASRGGMAGRLSYVDLHGLGAGYLENYVTAVSALTAEGVQRAALDHFDIGEMSLVVAGDLKTVRPQLLQLPEFADKVPPAP